MDVFEAIKGRRSIRSYKKGVELDDETVSKLAESLQAAPSANNFQPYYFIFVRDEELKKQVASICGGQRFVGDASLIIVGVSDPGANATWHRFDLAIALENAALEAVELGLGTCWIGDLREGELRKLLNVPEKYNIPVVLPVGVPETVPAERRKKPIDDLIKYEKFS